MFSKFANVSDNKFKKMSIAGMLPTYHIVAILLVCVDPDELSPTRLNVGRVNYSTICDHQRMEKLVEGLDNLSRFMRDDDDNDFKDVCEWSGVTCDKDGVNVSGIYWCSKRLNGTMDLSWIPPMVTFCTVAGNKLSGTLDTSMLPRNLKTLYLYSNKYIGTVDWESLPPNIERVSMWNNQLEGNVNLDVLPRSLIYLRVHSNNFTSVSGIIREDLSVSGIDGLHKI